MNDCEASMPASGVATYVDAWLYKFCDLCLHLQGLAMYMFDVLHTYCNKIIMSALTHADLCIIIICICSVKLYKCMHNQVQLQVIMCICLILK